MTIRTVASDLIVCTSTRLMNVILQSIISWAQEEIQGIVLSRLGLNVTVSKWFGVSDLTLNVSLPGLAWGNDEIYPHNHVIR